MLRHEYIVLVQILGIYAILVGIVVAFVYAVINIIRRRLKRLSLTNYPRYQKEKSAFLLGGIFLGCRTFLFLSPAFSLLACFGAYIADQYGTHKKKYFNF